MDGVFLKYVADGNVVRVKLLLDRGASTMRKKTAPCAERQRMDILRLLVALGADLEVGI